MELVKDDAPSTQTPPPTAKHLAPMGEGERGVGLMPLHFKPGEEQSVQLAPGAIVLGVETTVTMFEKKIVKPGEQAGVQVAEIIGLVIEMANVPDTEERIFVMIPAGARVPENAIYLGCAMIQQRTQAFFVYELTP